MVIQSALECLTCEWMWRHCWVDLIRWIWSIIPNKSHLPAVFIVYLNGQLAARQLIRLEKSCSSMWIGGLIILSGMIYLLAYVVSMFLGTTHHFDLCYCHVHIFTYEYWLFVLRLSVISNLPFYCADKIRTSSTFTCNQSRSELLPKTSRVPINLFFFFFFYTGSIFIF